MFDLQNSKFVQVLNAGTIATTTTSNQFDTLGAHAVCVTVKTLGATTTAKLSTLALYESDSTSSEGTAIAGFTGTTNTVTSTSDGFLIAANNTVTTASGGITYRFNINASTPRKRYLSVRVANAVTNPVNVAIWADLYRLEQSPSNATEAGVNVLVVG
jgi:hypothetical protein